MTNNLPENPSATVLRFIKGHACLALNRNDESLALFASCLQEKDKRDWLAWADSFAGRHSDSAVAQYFEGDAHARLGEWAKAEAALKHALTLKTNFFLAWNARGVVAHAVGNTLTARVYFNRSTTAKEDFVDGYLSQGTLEVYRNSTNANPMFEAAKKCSGANTPASLIKMGLGCVRYGAEDYNEALHYFSALSTNAFLYALAQRNATMTEVTRLAHHVRCAVRVGSSIKRIELRDEKSGRIVASLSGSERVPDDLPEGQVVVVTGPDGKEYIVWMEPLESDSTGDQGKAKDKNNLTSLPAPEAWPIEVWPPLPDLGSGIFMSTTGPGKRGGRGGGTTRPPSWGPPVAPGRDRPPVPQPPPGPKQGSKSTAEVIGALAGEIEKQTMASAPSMLSSPNGVGAPALAPVGGADSDSSEVRRNTGKWGVITLYGLLYPITPTSDKTTTAR
jgi:hypothetical protein